RAGVGAGVVAVEAEHARVRAVGPVAPTKHAALGYAVVPVEVVAFVVSFLSAFVREKGEGTEQDLGGASDCCRCGNFAKGAAAACVLRACDGGCPLPRATYIVQLH